jgi:hypothetical protein
MVMGYKDIVLSYFPNLIFLDASEIARADRKLSEDFIKGAKSAELYLNCVQLSRLPKPPKAEV